MCIYCVCDRHSHADFFRIADFPRGHVRASVEGCSLERWEVSEQLSWQFITGDFTCWCIMPQSIWIVKFILHNLLIIGFILLQLWWIHPSIMSIMSLFFSRCRVSILRLGGPDWEHVPVFLARDWVDCAHHCHSGITWTEMDSLGYKVSTVM